MGEFPFDSSLWDESSPAFVMMKSAYENVTASYGNIAMFVLFVIAVVAQIRQFVVCFISLSVFESWLFFGARVEIRRSILVMPISKNMGLYIHILMIFAAPFLHS